MVVVCLCGGVRVGGVRGEGRVTRERKEEGRGRERWMGWGVEEGGRWREEEERREGDWRRRERSVGGGGGEGGGWWEGEGGGWWEGEEGGREARSVLLVSLFLSATFTHKARAIFEILREHLVRRHPRVSGAGFFWQLLGRWTVRALLFLQLRRYRGNKVTTGFSRVPRMAP